VEFALTPNGISGIESVFAAVNTACPDLELSRLIDSISNATRRIYNLPEQHIEINSSAKITWFNPKQKFSSPGISGGVNDPWRNQELNGVVYGAINGMRVHLND
jgi:dihydroorotase-like cyclic amidohydrolase